VVLHPYFRALFDHCASLPDAAEGHPFGETVFRVGGHVFVFLGKPQSPDVTVKVRRSERRALLARSWIRRARWVGWAFGWVTASPIDDETLQCALWLVDRSYELVATRSLGAR
jgi:predicted DNA-binding protein (MmcQ/YjbR family)